MGNAPHGNGHGRPLTVHPHVHGERIRRNGGSWQYFGSSPRTWGTRMRCRSSSVTIRFIPTYMGNARRRFPPSLWRPVHPHVHGERMSIPTNQNPMNGSSPRTWGTLEDRRVRGVIRRFIPTYMGNAGIFDYRAVGCSVHPHVHGER